jgi:hypothetical protein
MRMVSWVIITYEKKMGNSLVEWWGSIIFDLSFERVGAFMKGQGSRASKRVDSNLPYNSYKGFNIYVPRPLHQDRFHLIIWTTCIIFIKKIYEEYYISVINDYPHPYDWSDQDINIIEDHISS